MALSLLLEIGTEELPASYVAAGTEALPKLLEASLDELRLSRGRVRALGTPRRLAVWVDEVAEQQPDLDEQVLGPPARVAFDVEGKPTKAALAFAGKLGIAVEGLTRVATDKGDYVAGRRVERGARTLELLPRVLPEIAGKIP